MSDTRRLSTDIPRLRARGGFAIALALGAIVVIGLLIAGSFFIAGQQSGSARADLSQEHAFRLAEAGLVDGTVNFDKETARLQTTPGASWTLPTTTVPMPAASLNPAVSLTATRLNAVLFQLTSTASVATGTSKESRKQIRQIVRLDAPAFNFLGALTLRGNANIGGSSFIDGADTPPDNWACGATKATMPGVVSADVSTIDTQNCTKSGKICIEGDPPIEQNPAAGHDSTYFSYGDKEWADLVAMATLYMTTQPKPAPAYLNGACDKTKQYNWGDPDRANGLTACDSYYPIIYYPGDAKLAGGIGQGIMLVEGDLEISGGFEFFGPVIVKGRIKTTGTGGHLNGGVMAANVDLEQNQILGDALINYSSCAIESAVAGASQVVPIRQRAWTEVF